MVERGSTIVVKYEHCIKVDRYGWQVKFDKQYTIISKPEYVLGVSKRQGFEVIVYTSIKR